MRNCGLKLAEENHILRAIIAELEREVTDLWEGLAWLQEENAQLISHSKKARLWW